MAPALTMPQLSPFEPLKDAAKYVRAFRDKPFVVKIGGDMAVLKGMMRPISRASWP